MVGFPREGWSWGVPAPKPQTFPLKWLVQCYACCKAPNRASFMSTHGRPTPCPDPDSEPTPAEHRGHRYAVLFIACSLCVQGQQQEPGMPPALVLIKRKESYRGECAGQSAGPERGARGRLRRIKAQSQEPTIGSVDSTAWRARD